MDDEVCPVCRSSTYLNPQMRFLVNSECYHKICKSCVDRIFSKGPSPCPYRSCGKILRRQKFKTQVFEDLKVEREVDVRQRITRIFNFPESSFATPREYDDYLEKIESIIFDLALPDSPENNEIKAKVDAEVREYEAQHKQEILDNALAQRQQRLMEEEMQKQQQERQRRLRILALELQSQEKEYRLIMQQETVAALAAGKNADDSLKEAADRAKQRTDLLRSQYEMELQRSKMAEQQAAQTVLTSATDTTKPPTPFTPFNGDKDHFLFHQQQQYFDPYLAPVAGDPKLRAGGFNAQFAEFGALATAFMGLEVDIQMEKAQKEGPVEMAA